MYITDTYNDGGHTATATIEDGTIATTYVQITGDAYDDEVLTADTSLLSDDDGMGTLAYQCRR